MADYQPRAFDIMNGDDLAERCKRAVARLDEPDLVLLLYYLELGSYRAVGRRFGVSHTFARKRVRAVQDKVRRMVEGER